MMGNRKKLIVMFYSMLFAALILSCEDNGEDIEATSFDREAMLTHWADNIIIPLHNQFSTSLSNLKSTTATFVASPNSDNLSQVRLKWIAAYKAWQYIEMYNVGKAEEIYFFSKMNIYPSNTERITLNISSAVYDLENANNNAARGFPALDYMLYGIDATDDLILQKYIGDVKYGTYLTDLVDAMVLNTETVVNAWNGSYRATFISSTENNATSSINKLINDFIYYYEKGFRSNKIGIPAGVFSGAALPKNVEGYYSRIYSKELVLEAYKGIETFFTGKLNGATVMQGLSLSDYTDHMEGNPEEKLSAAILAQFERAKTKINELDSNLVSQVESDNSEMLLTFDELQKAVILLKVDMLRAISINADYVDADGD